MVNAVPEADAQTQTDAFLDRAPSPWYVPQKSGADAETQICDGELFDFDYEVAPIADVIAEKTLEQSLMEMMEEEELATLKKRQVRRRARPP
ncbi:MAG: radial spoke 3 [Olpidium bornovanus]|uniref:Radial spoke 3 n=1 Tax=Olpidium bornovanus TaxID=278681 RepID=A0A8H7ZSS6_9FUNG|nr:MAG: radial spoke 3 [Olpidium bornovanus]